MPVVPESAFLARKTPTGLAFRGGPLRAFVPRELLILAAIEHDPRLSQDEAERVVDSYLADTLDDTSEYA